MSLCPKGTCPFAQRGHVRLSKGDMSVSLKGTCPFCPKGHVRFAQRDMSVSPKGTCPLRSKGHVRSVPCTLGHDDAEGCSKRHPSRHLESRTFRTTAAFSLKRPSVGSAWLTCLSAGTQQRRRDGRRAFDQTKRRRKQSRDKRESPFPQRQ